MDVTLLFLHKVLEYKIFDNKLIYLKKQFCFLNVIYGSFKGSNRKLQSKPEFN